MVYILQNLRQRQKTSDIDTLLVIQYMYYKIREVGGKICIRKVSISYTASGASAR